jgi:hypothetical protein
MNAGCLLAQLMQVPSQGCEQEGGMHCIAASQWNPNSYLAAAVPGWPEAVLVEWPSLPLLL